VAVAAIRRTILAELDRFGMHTHLVGLELLLVAMTAISFTDRRTILATGARILPARRMTIRAIKLRMGRLLEFLGDLLGFCRWLAA